MELTKYECVGFHATREESAKDILKTGKFICSNDEEDWLGTGIYFFENDKKQAEYFAKARNINVLKVLKADISSDKTLKLYDTETYEMYVKYVHMLKDKYQRRKDKTKRKIINSVALESLYKIKPYDIVVGIFEVPYMKRVHRTNIFPMHIQVCVKNHDCISDIKEA